jgi:hypothetical protein
MNSLKSDNGAYNQVYSDLGAGSFPSGNGTTPAGTVTYGGLMYQSVQTGTNAAFTTNTGQMELPTQYWGGAARIIAAGFEVTNTTAPIYQSGMVTTWRSPCPPFNNATSYQYRYKIATPSWSTPGYNDYLEFTMPPVNTQQAMLLNGSRQWAAKEGAYVVCAGHGMDNPPQYTNFTSPLLAVPNTNNPVQYVGEVPIVFNKDVNGNYGYGWTDKFWTPFDPCGAYFTGLSLQTTLTITWHVFVERFPSFEDSDLIVLATPSPKYDPQALELYSAVMSEIPTGVMVKENGLGDWFREAVKIAEDVVTPALSMIPHPAAQGIAKGLSFVTPVAKAIAGKKKQEKGDQETSEKMGAGLSRSSSAGRSANSGKAVKNKPGKGGRH